ncbi:competence type IV pilus ATPase ComGA [Bacillus pakistanensis]|uniref:competence type IV pilus ATPase ComGA n=1 Tax=Rossellomorea pakistanensis TaxID=992288 RepID=UPI001963F65A
MPPIEKLAEELLQKAVLLDASDVHFLPRKTDYIIQLRKQGTIAPHTIIPDQEGERIISHFKFMASMDIGEKRKPQSGSFSIPINDQPVSLRISTLPSTHSKESLVIRILPQNFSLPIQKMSLYPSSANKLLALLMHSHGLMIFTGPTGSGKTTTLYTLVQHCSAQLNRNVITLEDPVEKENEEFLQVQVNEKAGITYSTGLKAILRHDPDIIMVGEIRDRETAEIAIRASLTGHLVLTTMHTRDAKGAIYRLLEFGIQFQEIEQTLIAVSAQRLVKVKCPICKDTDVKQCHAKHYPKRTSVYEILSGKALTQVLREVKGEKSISQYAKLKDLLNKGVALGYLTHSEYERWAFEEET